MGAMLPDQDPRSRVSCGAKMASGKRGRICSPCRDSRHGRRADEQVVSFALGLYPYRARLGVLGLDYVFFHHFLNRDLQDELAQLRQRIYRQPDPPRPLALGNAATWAAQAQRVDPDTVISQFSMSSTGDRIDLVVMASAALTTPTSPARGTDTLLSQASNEPRWTDSLRRGASDVSSRLTELEEQLPAAYGTLHLALICGTPPLPPGVRASDELRLIPEAGWVPAIVLNVFSAKERDIRKLYEEMAGEQFEYTKKDPFPIGTGWIGGVPLPCLEVVCVPSRGKIPAPSAVQRQFREARSPVSRFFDGNIKARDYGYALRSWTMFVLIERRRMSHREALMLWNASAPHHLRYQYEPSIDRTQPGESLLSQELARLRQRLESWQPVA